MLTHTYTRGRDGAGNVVAIGLFGTTGALTSSGGSVPGLEGEADVDEEPGFVQYLESALFCTPVHTTAVGSGD